MSKVSAPRTHFCAAQGARAWPASGPQPDTRPLRPSVPSASLLLHRYPQRRTRHTVQPQRKHLYVLRELGWKTRPRLEGLGVGWLSGEGSGQSSSAHTDLGPEHLVPVQVPTSFCAEGSGWAGQHLAGAHAAGHQAPCSHRKLPPGGAWATHRSPPACACRHSHNSLPAPFAGPKPTLQHSVLSQGVLQAPLPTSQLGPGLPACNAQHTDEPEGNSGM